MLSIRSLSRLGLGPIDLQLAGGSVAAITGPSGAGKSMLLRAIADLDECAGQVQLDGEDRDSMAAPEWRKRVTYLAAESGWWNDAVARHFDDGQAARRLLPRLGLDQGALDWPVSRLSTGEKQRLALIRGIVQKPQVLLLDEPTSALDPDSRGKVEDLLAEQAAGGLSILIVSHDAEQAKRLNARVYRIENGRIADDGGTP